MNFVPSWTIGIAVGILIVSLMLYQRAQNKPRRYQTVTLTGQPECIILVLTYVHRFALEHFGTYGFGIERTIVVTIHDSAGSCQISTDYRVESSSMGVFTQQLQHLHDEGIEFTIHHNSAFQYQ